MNKIYVGNLPYGTTESELEAFFGEFGPIDHINIVTDRYTGRSKGFGFVEFANESSVEPAMEKNGTMLSGRPLKINVAREKQRDGGGRDGGGRDGGGRHDRHQSHHDD